MGISAKVAVAGAAGLFGLVIAAGGAVAASGSTLVADAPGTALQVQGIGAASATQLGPNARLKLLAAAKLDGKVETVFPASAIALGEPTTDSAATGGEQTATDPAHNNVGTTPNAPVAVSDSGVGSAPESGTQNGETDKTEKPVKPDESKPDKPAKPDNSKPVKPDESKPDKPAKPDNSKPDKPVKPDNSDSGNNGNGHGNSGSNGKGQDN